MTSGVHGSCHKLVGWRLPRFTLQATAGESTYEPTLGKGEVLSSSEFFHCHVRTHVSRLEGRSWICFQPSQQASLTKVVWDDGCEVCQFLKYTKLVCRFLQTQMRKEINEKCGESWNISNCFSKSCGMWLDGIVFLVINLFHSINFSTFPIPFPIGNTTRFFWNKRSICLQFGDELPYIMSSQRSKHLTHE